VGRFEGAVDGGPYVAQWSLWRRLVPARPNSVGMSSQCLAWCSSGGDGRTGLTVTGMTDPAGLTSRCGPTSAQKRHSRVPPAPFEGTACQSYGGRRHSVTELTPALPHSATQRRGWPPPGSWWNSEGARFPGVPKSWRASCGVRAFNARTRGQERGQRACGCPRARRTPPEGVLSPRARRTSLEGRG
jgi:hypothetical protein